MNRSALLRSSLLWLLLFLLPSSAQAGIEDCAGDLTPSNASNRIVELAFNVGSLCIELFDDQAPITTANFVAYLERGDLDGTFVHRAVAGFVIQTGGFDVNGDGAFQNIAEDPAIQNEPCTLDEAVPGTANTQRCSQRGNVRGSLAMAKVGDPACNGSPNSCVPRPGKGEFPRPEFVNSATSEWFINLADNRPNLDNQNGGFTVFAQVLGDGMLIADQIDAFETIRHASTTLTSDPIGLLGTFASLPLQTPPPFPAAVSGCFDGAQLAVLGNEELNLVGDPVTGDEFIVSGACGTEIAKLVDYSADPSQNPECPSNDQPAQEATQDGTEIVGGDRFYQLTCDEIEMSISSSRALMMPLVLQEIVQIDQALIVPAPGAGCAGVTSLGLLAGLARWRRGRAH